MALFHLLFTLIKISILACVYATLTLVAFRIIGHYKPESWFYKVSRRKWRLWFRSGFLISIGLFLFMFTHFGDLGFGDSARIPVGHWRAIWEVDATQAYIQEDGISALDIEKFIVTDDFVYGLSNSNFENYEGRFFVYDLDNNIVTTFIDEKEYISFLKANNLDSKPKYKDFGYYYNEYWFGWRFWMLP